MNSIQWTPRLRHSCGKLILRAVLFLAVLWCWLFRRDAMQTAMETPFLRQPLLLHLLWLIWTLMMVRHLAPIGAHSNAWRKAVRPAEPPLDQAAFREFRRQHNQGALKTVICWLAPHLVIAVLYFRRYLHRADLLLFSALYFLCDYICILLFCPFQTFLMHNRCCINCRIYDWGHWMMFTPMALIPSFFSLSLAGLALAVLLRWEYLWYRHPERFYPETCSDLQCVNCQERTCQLKHAVSDRSAAH